MEDRGESRNLDDFAAVNREVWQNFPRKTVRTSNKMEVKIHKFVRQLNISYVQWRYHGICHAYVAATVKRRIGVDWYTNYV